MSAVNASGVGAALAAPLLQAAAWIAGLCLVFGTLTVSVYRRRG